MRRWESSARTSAVRTRNLSSRRGIIGRRGYPGAQIGSYVEVKPLGYVKTLSRDMGGGYLSKYNAPDITGLLPN